MDFMTQLVGRKGGGVSTEIMYLQIIWNRCSLYIQQVQDRQYNTSVRRYIRGRVPLRTRDKLLSGILITTERW